MMKEESFHHMDKILSLGEISDKLYFVTKGKVAVHVNSHCHDFYSEFLDDSCSSNKSDKSKCQQDKKMFLCYLNPGSNFNHISAVFSH